MPATQSNVSPAEQLKNDINAVCLDIQALQTKITLAGILDKLEDIQIKVVGLQQRINNLRLSGFIFEINLEQNSKNISTKWQSIRNGVKLKEYQESTNLRTEIKPIESQIALIEANKNNIGYARKLLDALTIRVKNLEDKTIAVERTIHGMYDQFERDLEKFLLHINQIENSIKDLREACFQLLAQENLIQSVDAVWTKDGKEDKDDPKGVLFLTDQRLIFEQKEEVALKKVLFITTERKLVQNCLFEVNLTAIEKITATEQGIFKNKDFLELNLSSSAPYRLIQLHLLGQDSADWNSMINKVINGDYDKDRIIGIDPVIIEKVKNAPSICPNCGGAIQTSILRGMDQFNCDYCGITIRL
jgi:hypothetical protein